MAFRYMDSQTEEQRKRVQPHEILSGGMPGSTELRIGAANSVKLSGVDKAFSVTSGESTVLVGRITSGGAVGMSVTEADLTRFLATFDADGIFRLKISKNGADASTGTDDDLIFDSNRNLFKIVQTGTVQLTSPNSVGASTNVTVSHGIKNKPLVLAFVGFSLNGTRFPIPYNDIILIGADVGKVRFQVGMDIGDHTITFFHRDIVSASNVTDYIRYYILQETAA